MEWNKKPINRGECVLACVFAGLIYLTVSAVAEKLTITSYYPSPYGAYTELRTTENAFLATNTTGKVGIGTAAPQHGFKLDVRGAILNNYHTFAHGWNGSAPAGQQTWQSIVSNDGSYHLGYRDTPAAGEDTSITVSFKISPDENGGTAYFNAIDLGGVTQSNWPGGVPSGFCVFSVSPSITACPADWTRQITDNSAIRGVAGTPGGTGGVDMHTHEVFDRSGKRLDKGNHREIAANNTSGETSNWPPYIDVIVCCKD
ncbi:hypothetical protein ACFL6Y_07930 [Elusimicrobiota bacterium]